LFFRVSIHNPAMSVVRVDGLSKRYGARVGVEAVSFEVPEGAIFGFLGPNGSGKTTTIRVLMGFLRPGSGRASIFGLDCWGQSHRIKADVGYLPGDLRLYPWLTCRDAVRLVGSVHRRDFTAAGQEFAEEFGLDPTVRVRAMSRGMRQKVGLLLALVHRPRLLLLDEPTASLDPLMQETVYRRLRMFVSSGGTVFLSSHTLSEVERLCPRVAILREGRVVVNDSLENLRAQARRVVTIHWKDSQAVPEPPAFLTNVNRQDRPWRGELIGPSTELLRWAAGLPIEDLSIEQPDLSRLFQGFYA
jgi:ABC-2 type transport system ATP-binding protein